jgi:hypothetical protein
MRNMKDSFVHVLYKRLRKESGCPPVIAGKTGFSPCPYWAEVKDGSLLLEQINAQSLFEAKYICVQEWVKKYRPYLNN